MQLIVFGCAMHVPIYRIYTSEGMVLNLFCLLCVWLPPYMLATRLCTLQCVSPVGCTKACCHADMK